MPICASRRGYVLHVRVEVVKPDPRSCWQGYSKKVCADVRDESTESRSIVQSLCISSMIRLNAPDLRLRDLL